MDKPMFLKTISPIIINDLFQEDNGKWSLSRLSSCAMVLCVLVWISYLVIKTHTLPDLDGPALFAGLGGGTHYGIGKLAAWAQGKQDNPPNPDKTGT